MKDARIACLAGLLFAAMALPAAAEDGAVTTFRSWTVGCDNGRACRAFGFAPEFGIGFIRIDRAPDRDAEPAILLSGGEDDPADGATIVISADGAEIGRYTVGKELTKSDDQGVDVADAALRKTLLATVLKAKTIELLTISPKGEKGDPAKISLDGAAAALLWLDDRQKRVGTVTALVRPGPKAASTIPAPPALPPGPKAQPSRFPKPAQTVPPAVNATWLASDCHEDDPGRTPAEPAVFRLAPDKLLVSLDCGAGAYNFLSVFYLYRETDKSVTALTFHDPTVTKDNPHGDDQASLMNADFDPESLEMTFIAKGRGIGDCGSMGRYRWDGQRFATVEFSIMPECSGVMPGGWITTYRTAD